MFCDAKPIWVKNKRTVKNLQAGFTSCFVCDVDKEYSIKLSASTQYKLYLNGEFISYGPARAAHGYDCMVLTIAFVIVFIKKEIKLLIEKAVDEAMKNVYVKFVFSSVSST